MAKPALVKKYANRRLYDTEQSAYVTLNQLAQMIRKGREVKVIDARTKEDVTAFILTQIILEEAKHKNALLPPPLLHLIIRFGDNLLSEFFEKYLHQSINRYLSHKSAFDYQFKKWLELGMNISEIGPKTMGAMEPFRSFMDIFSRGKQPDPGPDSTDGSD